MVPALIATQGGALAALLALDGSPGWRVARVLAVIVLTASTAWLTRRAGGAVNTAASHG